MRLRLLCLAIVTLVATIAAACGGDGDEPTRTPTQAGAPAAAQAAAQVATPTGTQPTPLAAAPTGAQPTPPAATPTGAQPTPPAATPTGAQPTPPAATPTGAQPTPPAATPTGAQPGQKATLRIWATDAPPKDVTKILITVSEIQVQSSGDEPWLTVVSGPVEFDLVEIQGVEQILGEAELDPGRYGQIRLTVEKAEVTVQGNTVSARVPSDKLKIVGGFDLVAGQTTILTLDFDAEKSVVIAGTRNVLIKPTVKLLIRAGDQELALRNRGGRDRRG